MRSRVVLSYSQFPHFSLTLPYPSKEEGHDLVDDVVVCQALAVLFLGQHHVDNVGPRALSHRPAVLLQHGVEVVAKEFRRGLKIILPEWVELEPGPVVRNLGDAMRHKCGRTLAETVTDSR